MTEIDILKKKLEIATWFIERLADKNRWHDAYTSGAAGVILEKMSKLDAE